jgi:hypothetical protein
MAEIQWRRQEDGNLIPCYKDPGAIQWLPYTRSPHRVKDPAFVSPGMATWCVWVSLGYQVVEGTGDDG